jgi:error-prone DNA polymerase
MARLFADHPEALANSLAVLEASAGFSLDQLALPRRSGHPR